MAFLAPLAPLVLPAIFSGAVTYGVGQYMQHQAKKNQPSPTPASAPKAVAPQPTPVGGSYAFENANPAVSAAGGDSAIAIDPLGKAGGGKTTRTTMLGR